MTNDDLVQRVIGSVQAVVAKAVAEAESRFEQRLLDVKTQQEATLQLLRLQLDALPTPKDGQKGADAAPVDYVAIRAEVEQLVAAAVSGLPPPQDGPKGDKGDKGDTGEPPDEKSIAQAVEINVRSYVTDLFRELPLPRDGINGNHGQNGEPGLPGENGRDALEIDVMEGILDYRTYARGTWATFEGSLWRSIKQTVPLKEKADDNGWRCAVAGIGAITFDFDIEARSLVIDWKHGDVECTKSIEIPIPLDRGVHTMKEYRKGDVVSLDGSSWIVRDGPTSDLPGTSKAWRLFVMRGRNGKDADRAARIETPVRLR